MLICTIGAPAGAVKTVCVTFDFKQKENEFTHYKQLHVCSGIEGMIYQEPLLSTAHSVMICGVAQCLCSGRIAYYYLFVALIRGGPSTPETFKHKAPGITSTL